MVIPYPRPVIRIVPRAGNADLGELGHQLAARTYILKYLGMYLQATPPCRHPSLVLFRATPPHASPAISVD